MADVRLEGMQELLDQLNKLGDKASRVENQALKAGAEIVQKEAESLAPRSPETKEHLADNIKISGVKTKDGVKFVEIGPTKGDNSKFFYGKFLEFGTSKMPAQPFMGPAFEKNKGTIMNAMKQVVKRGLGL